MKYLEEKMKVQARRRSFHSYLIQIVFGIVVMTCLVLLVLHWGQKGIEWRTQCLKCKEECTSYYGQQRVAIEEKCDCSSFDPNMLDYSRMTPEERQQELDKIKRIAERIDRRKSREYRESLQRKVVQDE